MIEHDDRDFLAELLAVTRMLEQRMRAATRAGFGCRIATRAARRAALHLVLAVDALRDGAEEMDAAANAAGREIAPADPGIGGKLKCLAP